MTTSEYRLLYVFLLFFFFPVFLTSISILMSYYIYLFVLSGLVGNSIEWRIAYCGEGVLVGLSRRDAARDASALRYRAWRKRHGPAEKRLRGTAQPGMAGRLRYVLF